MSDGISLGLFSVRPHSLIVVVLQKLCTVFCCYLRCLLLHGV